VAEIPKERRILKITDNNITRVILEDAKIQIPPRRERPAHTEKMTKKT
jgi:hypothetical protein